MTRRQTIAVVPAAGASRRFGSPKLLADIRGEPLLQHTLRSLLDGGVERLVVVVAPHANLSTVTMLGDSRVTVVINRDPERGMFSSIQTGLAQVDGDADVLVLPADMPFVRASTVEALMKHRPDTDGGVCVSRQTRTPDSPAPRDVDRTPQHAAVDESQSRAGGPGNRRGIAGS
jgi:CTP:molybdopterin cytidylyltransferase MocA